MKRRRSMSLVPIAVALAAAACSGTDVGITAKVKTRLANALNARLDPIRERRAAALARPQWLREMLFEGSKRARKVAAETMTRVRDAVKVTYR